MLIKEIMTKDPEVVEAETPLREAAQKMQELDVGSIPVFEGRQMIGIITDRDIAIRGTAAGLDPNHTVVKKVFTPNVCTCYEDQEVREAAQMMCSRQVRRLLILRRNGELAGIVSLGDVAASLGNEELAVIILKHVSQPALEHSSVENEETFKYGRESSRTHRTHEMS